MTPYKLKILNGVLKLKSFADVVLNIFGIKDLGTQTGNVTDGLVDWTIQHLTKTTAQWNGDSTTILLKGQLGIEDTSTTTFKLKVGDGVSLWSQLGYISGGGGNDYPENLYLTVINKTGDNLLASGYKVLRVSSAQGQRLAVDYAQANNDANSTDTIGVVYENINNNQTGKLVAIGELTGLNTTGSLQGETWADGDVIYLSPFTEGQITNIKPTAPNHLVTLGYVVYAHANHGKIYIKCDNGYELQELHNVYAPSPSNNDSIFWNTNNLRYENKSIATVLGYTPASSTEVNSKGYVLNFGFSSFSPADATNYYVGQNNANPFTTDTQVKLIAIKTSTIKKIAITSRQSAGTSENSTFAIGINGTYTNFSTTVKFDGIPNNELLITGLSINVTEGQTLSIKWTTPTWVTNPTGIIGNINIYFE